MSAIQHREPVCYDAFEVTSGRCLGGGKVFPEGNLTTKDVLLAEQAAWSEDGGDECYLIQISYEQYERSLGRTPDIERDWAEHLHAKSAAGLSEWLGT